MPPSAHLPTSIVTDIEGTAVPAHTANGEAAAVSWVGKHVNPFAFDRRIRSHGVGGVLSLCLAYITVSDNSRQCTVKLPDAFSVRRISM